MDLAGQGIAQGVEQRDVHVYVQVDAQGAGDIRELERGTHGNPDKGTVQWYTYTEVIIFKYSLHTLFELGRKMYEIRVYTVHTVNSIL